MNAFPINPKPVMLLIAFFLLLIVGCDKDNSEPDSTEETNEVFDIDGNRYTTVTIGEQVWMVENLGTTQYNDGEPIALVEDSGDWSNLQEGAYCWYDNDRESHMESYGALYSRDAAKSERLCPVGWQVPGQEDWEELIDFLGGDVLNPNWDYPGRALKDTGYVYWREENILHTTNETGWSGRGGGMRDANGNFIELRESGNWWSSEDHWKYDTWGHQLGYNHGYFLNIGSENDLGFSVRCIQSVE